MKGDEALQSRLTGMEVLSESAPAHWIAPVVGERVAGTGHRADRRQFFRRFTNRAVESLRDENGVEEVVRGEVQYDLKAFRRDLFAEVATNLASDEEHVVQQSFDLIYDLCYWEATGREFCDFVATLDETAFLDAPALRAIKEHMGDNITMLGAILQRMIMDGVESGLVPGKAPDGRGTSGLGPEGLDHGFIAFQVRSLQQIDTVGYGWEHRIQALSDGLGLAGQVDDQRAVSQAGGLA